MSAECDGMVKREVKEEDEGGGGDAGAPPPAPPPPPAPASADVQSSAGDNQVQASVLAPIGPPIDLRTLLQGSSDDEEEAEEEEAKERRLREERKRKREEWEKNNAQANQQHARFLTAEYCLEKYRAKMKEGEEKRLLNLHRHTVIACAKEAEQGESVADFITRLHMAMSGQLLRTEMEAKQTSVDELGSADPSLPHYRSAEEESLCVLDADVVRFAWQWLGEKRLPVWWTDSEQTVQAAARNGLAKHILAHRDAERSEQRERAMREHKKSHWKKLTHQVKERREALEAAAREARLAGMSEKERAELDTQAHYAAINNGISKQLALEALLSETPRSIEYAAMRDDNHLLRYDDSDYDSDEDVEALAKQLFPLALTSTPIYEEKVEMQREQRREQPVEQMEVDGPKEEVEGMDVSAATRKALRLAGTLSAMCLAPNSSRVQGALRPPLTGCMKQPVTCLTDVRVGGALCQMNSGEDRLRRLLWQHAIREKRSEGKRVRFASVASGLHRVRVYEPILNQCKSRKCKPSLCDAGSGAAGAWVMDISFQAYTQSKLRMPPFGTNKNECRSVDGMRNVGHLNSCSGEQKKLTMKIYRHKYEMVLSPVAFSVGRVCVGGEKVRLPGQAHPAPARRREVKPEEVAAFEYSLSIVLKSFQFTSSYKFPGVNGNAVGDRYKMLIDVRMAGNTHVVLSDSLLELLSDRMMAATRLVVHHTPDWTERLVSVLSDGGTAIELSGCEWMVLAVGHDEMCVDGASAEQAWTRATRTAVRVHAVLSHMWQWLEGEGYELRPLPRIALLTIPEIGDFRHNIKLFNALIRSRWSAVSPRVPGGCVVDWAGCVSGVGVSWGGPNSLDQLRSRFQALHNLLKQHTNMRLFGDPGDYNY